jgi:hypothetical protein
MFSFVSFASSKIEKLGRAIGNSVIGIMSGDADRGTDAEVYGTHGIVSRPSKATKGIRIRIGSLSIVIASYTYGVEPPADEGSTKVYSTDLEGVEKASVNLGATGLVEIKNEVEALGELFHDTLMAVKAIKTFGSSTSHTLTQISKDAIDAIDARAENLLGE